MASADVLRTPTLFKDLVWRLLHELLNDQFPAGDIKDFLDHSAPDHPARSIIVESIGRACLESRLKQETVFAEFGMRYEDFQNQIIAYIRQHTTEIEELGNTETGCGEGQVVAQDSCEGVGKDSSSAWPQGSTSHFPPALSGSRDRGGGIRDEIRGASVTTFSARSLHGYAKESDLENDWNSGASGWQSARQAPTTVIATAAPREDENFHNGTEFSNDIGENAGLEENRQCRRCHEIGHIAQNCPSFTCCRCGAHGHYVKDCYENDVRVCYGCGQPGHISRECPDRLPRDDRRNRRSKLRGGAVCIGNTRGLPHNRQLDSIHHVWEDRDRETANLAGDGWKSFLDHSVGDNHIDGQDDQLARNESFQAGRQSRSNGSAHWKDEGAFPGVFDDSFNKRADSDGSKQDNSVGFKHSDDQENVQESQGQRNGNQSASDDLDGPAYGTAFHNLSVMQRFGGGNNWNSCETKPSSKPYPSSQASPCDGHIKSGQPLGDGKECCQGPDRNRSHQEDGIGMHRLSSQEPSEDSGPSHGTMKVSLTMKRKGKKGRPAMYNLTPHLRY